MTSSPPLKVTSSYDINNNEPGVVVDYGKSQPVVHLSSRFLLLSALVTSLLGFAVGTAVRNVLLNGGLSAVLFHPHDDSSLYDEYVHHAILSDPSPGTSPDPAAAPTDRGAEGPLPQPIPRRGRAFPRTVYSSKDFKKPHVITSDSVHMHAPPEECVEDTCAAEMEHPPADDDDDDSLHLPAGQHLLFDVKNVSPSFLDSEKRLAQAMVDAIHVADLTLLSYHCHSLTPKGVSCVGVLLESHISFHTWPDEGVITLDLFTCGAKSLLPAVKSLAELFGVPAAPALGWDKPQIMWSHFLRGFRPAKELSKNPYSADMGRYLLSYLTLDMKEEVKSVVTDYQRIDVYDVINPRFNSLQAYERSLSSDGSYESLHPELYRPNRIVFLDGVMQSMSQGDSEYHEALVHPAMFTHGSPRRVAIIGGGEGATLREVLKHEGLEYVAMIEIDEKMVATSREYLPDWSDCSDLVGSEASCLDDPKAEVFYKDAMQWFVDRYSPECDCEAGDEHRHFCRCGDAAYYAALDKKKGQEKIAGDFDVIFMDALDPSDNKEFTDYLYNNDRFLEALFDSLTENGVIVLQLGESVAEDAAPDEVTGNSNRANIIKVLERYGFETFHIYDEEHCGFNWPWSFFLACKSASCDENFYKNEAQINIAVHQNIRRTKSKKPALKHFDGAIMSGYQLPSIHWEHLFCRNRGEDQTSCADMFPRDEDQVLMANVDIPTGFEKALGGKDVVRNEMATAAVKTKEAMDAKMVPFLGKWNPMISRKASHKYMTA